MISNNSTGKYKICPLSESILSAVKAIYTPRSSDVVLNAVMQKAVGGYVGHAEFCRADRIFYVSIRSDRMQE